MERLSIEKKLEQTKEQRRNSRKKGFTMIIVSFLLAFFLLWIFLKNPFVAAIASFILLPVIIFFVTYFILAPVRIFGYFVRQSHLLLIMEGEGYTRSDLQLDGHTLTEKGWIVPLEGESIPEKFGIDPGEKIKTTRIIPVIHNLRFFKLLGLFEEPFEGILRWEKYNPTTQEVTKEEDVMWDWVVAPYNYGLKIKDIYSKDNVPISFNMGILGQPFNPPLSQFLIKDWYKAFISEVYNVIFEEIRNSDYNDLQKEDEELAMHFYKKFEEQKKYGDDKGKSTIRICLEKYGIYIIKIQISKLTVPKEIIDAANEPIRQEFEKKAVAIQAQMNQERLVTEMSATDALFQRRTATTPEEFASLIKNPEEFKRIYGPIYNKCRRDVLDGMAIRQGTGVRIFTEGKGTGGNELLSAAAVFQKTFNNSPIQKKENEKASVEDGESNKKNITDKTREALKKAGIPFKPKNDE
ncbi:MAG: SPFH domain-containing protein [Candidatus Paceibacterota bacterium]|jgi:hypothetical protein